MNERLYIGKFLEQALLQNTKNKTIIGKKEAYLI